MWTPQGYYTGSPGADKIVGWQINKGPETAADYVGADQLRQHLNRPDIVEKAIILASAEQASASRPAPPSSWSDLLARPVPKFRIVSPAGGSNLRGGRAPGEDRHRGRDRSDQGDPRAGQRPSGRRDHARRRRGRLRGRQRTLDVPLGQGPQRGAHHAHQRTSATRPRPSRSTSEGDGDLDKRGTLYILAIGVDQLPGARQHLRRAAARRAAISVTRAPTRASPGRGGREAAGPGHTKVVKRVLVNGATADDAPTDDARPPTTSSMPSTC